MAELPEGVLGENKVLSNRDKAQHGDERGLDSKTVQTEQYQDHATNKTGSGKAAKPVDDNAADT